MVRDAEGRMTDARYEAYLEAVRRRVCEDVRREAGRWPLE